MYMLHIKEEIGTGGFDVCYFGKSIDKVKEWAIREEYEEEDFTGIYEVNLIEGKEILPYAVREGFL